MRILLAFSVLAFLGASPMFGQVINERTTVTAAYLPEFGAFGYSIDLDDGLLVVGAPWSEHNGYCSGAAYVYDAVTGVFVSKLLPPILAEGGEFGRVVAISDGLVVVGLASSDAHAERGGAAYVFDALTGNVLHDLKPTHTPFPFLPPFCDITPGDGFGGGVDIDAGIVVVTSLGNTDYFDPDNVGAVFMFSAFTGAQIGKIVAPDPNPLIRFAFSCSIDDDLVAISATGEGDGSMYVFHVSDGSLVSKIVPDTDPGNYAYGSIADMHEGVVAIAGYHDTSAGPDAAEVYVHDAVTGVEFAAVAPEAETLTDNKRYAVGVGSGIVAVGVPFDPRDSSNSTGRVQVFDTGTGQYLSDLLPAVPSSFQSGGGPGYFGTAIAIDGTTVAVSAGRDAVSMGSAIYIFEAAPCTSADLAQPYGVVNVDDIDFFVLAYLTGNPGADCDANGLWNVDDIDCFVAAFLAGCP